MLSPLVSALCPALHAADPATTLAEEGLRGPRSTFFGQKTISGTIRLTTPVRGARTSAVNLLLDGRRTKRVNVDTLGRA
ncbi:MAG: hypothetical protein ACT4QA_19510 [Panacagrimonas sp.]